MTYTTIKEFKGIPAGTELSVSKGRIMHEGKELCCVASQNAYDFLALNTDGNGQERFQLIESILDKLRYLSVKHALEAIGERAAWEEAKAQAQSELKEGEELGSQWDEFVPQAEDKRAVALSHFKAKHLTDGVPNHAFRTASIKDLRDLWSEIKEI